MISFKSYLIAAGLLMLFAANCLRAQNIPDSLLQKLATSSNDSAKGIILLEIGESIEQTTPEKSMDYYRQALALGQRIKNNRVILSSYTDLGICYISLNKMDSSIMAFEKGIPFARLLKDTVREARTLANIGNAYLHKKDRVTAIEYYLKAARLWETCLRSTISYPFYIPISTHYWMNRKNIPGRWNSEIKRLTMAQKLGDEFSVVIGLVNLSTTYSHLGST